MKIESGAPVLLDTHVWYWFVNGELAEDFPAIDRQIQSHVDRSVVYVAAISLWEIAMLDAKKRIRLTMDCFHWLKRALGAPGIELEDLSPEVAVASVRLEGNAPRDPSDRLILASAMSLGAVLVTRDREMIQYCEDNRLPCLAF